jgi:transcriptional regulator with XRE-family HTH domain
MSCKDMLIDHLKARREALGWSVKEVGDHAGLDTAVISQWERGDAAPGLDALAGWATALGLALSLMPAEAEARRGLQVDWQARRICVDGTPVRLTPMEWKALERLSATPGELVPHLDLFRHLYGETEPYRAQSTAIRVLITKLRRLLPPLRIEAQWGRGYVISGIAGSSPRGTPQAEAVVEPPAEPAPPKTDRPRETVALTAGSIMIERTAMRRNMAEMSHPQGHRTAIAPSRPNPCRAEELTSIERFLAERGVTRCPDVATIQHAPLPTLVWDKMKRKWVRPPSIAREAS